VISYCIACYRPRYAAKLVEDLVRKTSVPFEILVWLNVADAEFENFLAHTAACGAPVRIVGKTPENIGMEAYRHLFACSRYELIVQVEDDVLFVSPRVAETAEEIFSRFPRVGMLVADVWQDEYTSGARPPMSSYTLRDCQYGLYEGPLDGWFAVYRKASLGACGDICAGRYFCLGSRIKGRLAQLGQQAWLCTRMKVFHATGPIYAAYFGMYDFQIEKYRSLGRTEVVNSYLATQGKIPSTSELGERVQMIQSTLSSHVLRRFRLGPPT
jgi:hypothetical protein